MKTQFSSSATLKRTPKNIKGIYEKATGSGIWWIRYADRSGRIRREKAGTRSSAIALYQKRKTEVLEGRKFPERLRTKGMSFALLAKDTLDYSKSHKLSYQHDVYRMKKILEGFGNRSADSISPLDIERWLTSQAEQNHWKPATVNRFKALLSLTFRLGVDNGKIQSNPAKLVRRRREDSGRIRWLSHGEEAALRAAIVAIDPERILELDIALNTGLRKSEQYRLTWDCVGFDQKLLTICGTKNGQTRHIPMNSAVVAAFRALERRSLHNGHVFIGRSGEKLSSPRHWFEKAVRDAGAGLRNFTWHCLRHTFASRLVMAGVDLRTVQELMGHKTIAMTCRYAHLAPSHKLAAVERLATPVGLHDAPTDTRTDTDTLEVVCSASPSTL